MFYRIAMPLLLMFAPRLLPVLIRFLRLVWRLQFDRRVNIVLRLLLPLALIYAIIPSKVQLIPDWVPYLGRFDDLIIVGLALLFLTKLAPKAVVDEHNGVIPPPDPDPAETAGPDKVVDGSSRLVDD